MSRIPDPPPPRRPAPLVADKVIIVSGVGPGMGQAAARALARDGATVVLVARDQERLAAVASEIVTAGGSAMIVPTDICDPDARRELVATVMDAHGRIDGLVNSAFRPDPAQTFVEADLDQWRKIFDVNVWGTLGLTQDVVPHMISAGSGSIVFVLSMVMRKPMPRQGAYAASKGALAVAARMLAHELAPSGVRVNSVVPGWMWGPSVHTYVSWLVQSEGITEEEAAARIGAAIPTGEIPRQEDCAEPIVFLMSDRAQAVVGQTIDANGGEVMV